MEKTATEMMVRRSMMETRVHAAARQYTNESDLWGAEAIASDRAFAAGARWVLAQLAQMPTREEAQEMLAALNTLLPVNTQETK